VTGVPAMVGSVRVTLHLTDLLPSVLPTGWRDAGPWTPPAAYSFLRAHRFEVLGRPGDTLQILVSLDDANDGAGIWLHSSCSRGRRLPTWDDLKDVHQVVHADRPVVQVMPPRSSWLNAMPYCLHLFERMDADTVPRAIWERR
jgi:hypothetical protein